jgi:O-antigen ligase
LLRATVNTRDHAAAALPVAAGLAVGLLLGTRQGLGLVGAVGAVVLFLILVWDLRFVVPLLAVMLPFGPRFEMGFGNLYLSTAILLIAYLAWAVRTPALREGLVFKYDAVVLGVIALMGAFVLSSLQNYAILLSEKTAMLKFIQFLLYTGLFVMVYQMDFARRDIRRLFILILVAGFFEGLVGAMQWVTRPGLYVAGTFDNEHNLYASYAAFMAVVFLGVTLESRRAVVRLAGVLALAVILYSIVFSFSRTAYISLLTSLLMFAFLPVSRAKRMGVPAAGLAAAAGVILIVPASVADRMRNIMETATGQYVALSYRYRVIMWKQALKDFTESPLLGKGAWAYELRDNFFVKAGAEAGIVGLGTFLILVFFILRALRRSAAYPFGDDFMRGVAVGFFPAAFGSLVVFNLAGDFLAVHRFIGVFWIGLALLLRYTSAGGNVTHAAKEAPEGTLR